MRKLSRVATDGKWSMVIRKVLKKTGRPLLAFTKLRNPADLYSIWAVILIDIDEQHWKGRVVNAESLIFYNSVSRVSLPQVQAILPLFICFRHMQAGYDTIAFEARIASGDDLGLLTIVGHGAAAGFEEDVMEILRGVECRGSKLFGNRILGKDRRGSTD
jgi:hypothetical protein